MSRNPRALVNGHDQVSTPQFKAWFGQSKVVDAGATLWFCITVRKRSSLSLEWVGCKARLSLVSKVGRLPLGPSKFRLT
jgi:hypothetical protein